MDNIHTHTSASFVIVEAFALYTLCAISSKMEGMRGWREEKVIDDRMDKQDWKRNVREETERLML
jgi:hypothetical protein